MHELAQQVSRVWRRESTPVLVNWFRQPGSIKIQIHTGVVTFVWLPGESWKARENSVGTLLYRKAWFRKGVVAV